MPTDGLSILLIVSGHLRLHNIVIIVFICAKEIQL